MLLMNVGQQPMGLLAHMYPYHSDLYHNILFDMLFSKSVTSVISDACRYIYICIKEAYNTLCLSFLFSDSMLSKMV